MSMWILTVAVGVFVGWCMGPFALWLGEKIKNSESAKKSLEYRSNVYNKKVYDKGSNNDFYTDTLNYVSWENGKIKRFKFFMGGFLVFTALYLITRQFVFVMMAFALLIPIIFVPFFVVMWETFKQVLSDIVGK